MKHVFISHASTDYAIAAGIRDELEAQGVACWIAPDDLSPGQDYGSQIISGIEDTVATILVLSSNANNSTYVTKEIERAVSKSKYVIPVRIENVKPSSGLELFISSSHWVDLWQPPRSAKIERLATQIKALHADKAAEGRAVETGKEALPVSASGKKSASRKKRYVAGALFALVAIAGSVMMTQRAGHFPAQSDAGQGTAAVAEPVRPPAPALPATSGADPDGVVQRPVETGSGVRDDQRAPPASASVPIPEPMPAPEPAPIAAKDSAPKPAKDTSPVPKKVKPSAVVAGAPKSGAEPARARSGASGAPPARCSTIVQRVSLGEPLSSEDEAFLKNHCR